jgi:hypothetical protein
VFAHGSGQEGFVVDKMALEQVFSEYFGFPCHSSFHQLLHNHPHLSALEQVFSEYFGFPCQSSFHQLLHNHPHLIIWGCTIGQKWPQYLVT